MLFSKTILFNEFILNYYDPITVHSYCKSCNHYNLNYSCPVHLNPVIDKLKKFNYLTVYVFEYNIPEFNDIDNIYNSIRNSLDKEILNFESIIDGTSLIPGRCLLCNPCYKELHKPCPKPDLIRYSLETIGFDVSKVIENEFQKKLTWNKDKLTLVFGFLSNEIPTDEFHYKYEQQY
ncbi:MAG: hypothetical protein JW702_10205 [Clostridiales bacterium]|nr:hypothetical protein [Clostridiales bacterium]